MPLGFSWQKARRLSLQRRRAFEAESISNVSEQQVKRRLI